jgi:hypothetical protein
MNTSKVQYSAVHECYVTMTHREAREGKYPELWNMGHTDRFDGKGKYDSRCTSCWLGHPHTVAVHDANMERYFENRAEQERREEALYAIRFPNSDGY